MNVMLSYPLPLWEDFVRSILVDMHRCSLRGFAVNFCSSRRPDLRPDELYCSPPDKWVRYCEEAFGCSVEVVSDYGLREYTFVGSPDAAIWPGGGPAEALTQRRR